MQVHKSITKSKITKAAKESLFGTKDTGWCLSCGKKHQIEGDATKVLCNHCGQDQVYGALSLVMLVC